jgi:leader peptidase (prepilin peptidase)/N-methyltransferase
MPPTTAATVFTAVMATGFGLVIGSFLNVVIYRAPRGQSIVRPASRCPRCGAELSGWENVPVVSWLALRGRCRHCHEPISARYPLVETALGASFGVLAWAVGPAAALAPVLLIWAAILSAAVIDLDRLRVPRMVVAAEALGAFGLLLLSLVEHGEARIGWGALGAVLSAGAGAIGARHPSDRAWGRIATVAVLGWVTGWFWPAGGLIVAGLTALAATLGLVARSIARRRDDHEPLDHGQEAAGTSGRARWSGAGWLLPLAAGVFWVVVAGAALRGP